MADFSPVATDDVPTDAWMLLKLYRRECLCDEPPAERARFLIALRTLGVFLTRRPLVSDLNRTTISAARVAMRSAGISEPVRKAFMRCMFNLAGYAGQLRARVESQSPSSKSVTAAETVVLVSFSGVEVCQ